MYKRTLNNQFERLLNNYPVLIVTGPRQVGKSTAVYELTKTHNFKYVTLDDLAVRAQALEDPVFFIQEMGYPLIIDEVQYAPILLEVIESIVNKKRLLEGDANGMFVLTGSQTFELMQGVTQSLAGRATIVKMMPLSYNETIEVEEKTFLPKNKMEINTNFDSNVSRLFKRIVRGFFPELYRNDKLDSSKFYSDYVSTYIDRDISELINIKDKLKFHNFLQHLATLTAQQVNYSNIARNVGVDENTIKSWISILETSGLIYLVQPYSEIKLTKRIVKAPKLYFCDTGLAAYLAKIYDSENLMISNLAGAYFETYVMNEIVKSYINNNKKFDGYYYRDNNQNEIDLVILQDLKLHCIEIKKGSLFTKKDVKSFNQLSESQYEIGTSCILCNTEENYALAENLYVYSIGVI